MEIINRNVAKLSKEHAGIQGVSKINFGGWQSVLRREMRAMGQEEEA